MSTMNHFVSIQKSRSSYHLSSIIYIYIYIYPVSKYLKNIKFCVTFLTSLSDFGKQCHFLPKSSSQLLGVWRSDLESFIRTKQDILINSLFLLAVMFGKSEKSTPSNLISVIYMKNPLLSMLRNVKFDRKTRELSSKTLQYNTFLFSFLLHGAV